MKLNTLLIGGFLIVAFMCGIIGFVAIETFNKVENINAQLQKDFVPNTILMVEMEKKAYKVYSKGTEYIVIHREYKEKAAEIKAEMIETMSELKELGDNHFEYARYLSVKKRKNAQQILDKIVTFNYAINGIINFREKNIEQTKKINKRIAQITTNLVNNAHSILVDHLVGHKMEHMQELKDANIAVVEAHISTRNLIIITTFVIIVFAIMIGLFISRSVTRPINELKENAKKFGKGNLDARIKIKSKNEIGELAVSFNHMADDLKLSSEAERKKSEELQNLTRELIESGERFKRLSNLTFEGILIHNNGIAIDVNESLTKMFGYTKNEILGKNIIELLIPHEYRPLIKENIIKDRAKPYEAVAMKKDGTLFPIELEANNEKMKNEKFQVSAVRDITEQIKMRRALKEASNIINRSPAVAFLWENTEGWPVEFVSENVKEVFGYSSDDFTSGKVSYSAVIHPDDLERVQAEVSTFSNEKINAGFIHQPYRIITKQGEVKWMDDRTFIRKDKKGDITHYEGIVLDVTTQKRITEKKKSAEKALQLEHDKLQSVLNGIGEGMYIVDKDFNIEFQNHIFIEYFGNCKGKKCYKNIFKRDEPCQDCLINEAIRTKSLQQNETSFLDGKYYDMSFSPLKQHKGADKVIVLIKDITEKRNFQAEAIRTNHLASLGELAAGVAHEINNPITGIISLAEIISDEAGDDGRDVDFPNRIIKEADRIGEIVKNLLSFARDRKEEHSPVHINDILNDAFSLTEKQISKDGIHFSVIISPDLPKIKARRQEIQQVFLNIISNARYSLNEKFHKTHVNKIFEITGEQIEINGKMHVRIIFYDKGMGIADNILNKVSDPFFSTKPHGEGTGLGLSISHGIISSHGGKLWLESQEKEYTKVMVDLPIGNGWTLKEEV